MRRSGLAGWSLLVYAFLYLPLVVLAAYSFNASRLSAEWQGFTLDWYRRALGSPAVLAALRNSVLVALGATLVCTVAGTAAALALERHAWRRRRVLDASLALPLVVPEVVLGSSLLLLFATLGLRLGFTTVVLAHVAFGLSYVVVVVRARLAGFDESLEEAAMDLGAGPWRTLTRVTLPLLAPGIVAGALLVFALSLDDYVVTSFVSGVGSTTLPLHIYSLVRSGVSPEINAVSTILLVATTLLLVAADRFERGARGGAAVAGLAVLVLAAPLAAAGGVPAGERVLNVYIWSNYIGPETIRKFEERHDVKVNVDLYDSNEALLAKLQAGNADYDVVCPSNYVVETLRQTGALLELDHSALPAMAHVDARFLDQPHDPGNRYSVPYFWGTAGIAYRRSRTGPVDSWAALWDPRFAGRILMLDDPRETLGAALRRRGRGYNETDPGELRAAQRMLVEQRPLVRAYDSASFDTALLSGDVWIAQAWSGQIARAMDEDPDIAWVIPKEGSSLFLDSLAIPRGAPHPELAHAFLDFVTEPAIAAEITRTMRYSTPNASALPLVPAEMRANGAMFPPADDLARTELINDVGEATVLYERLWTEVKSGG